MSLSHRSKMGNSEDRRRRKQWLLDHFGNGVTVPCAFQGCTAVLSLETLTVDRFPDVGGSYRRDNIRPACMRCQCRQGQQIVTTIMKERRAHGLSEDHA